MVIRQQGLSLAKVTGFGLFVASERGGWNVLRDAISGLEADLGHAHQVHLLADPDDARAVFSISPPGDGIELSVRLDRHDWKSRSLREMVDLFQGLPINARDRLSLDVGAWLDEWERTSPRDKKIDWNIAAALDECRCLEVEVRTGMHRVRAAFRPAFLDSEGPVLRIADAMRTHVVFADTGAPGFRWSNQAPGHLKIQSVVAERVEEAVAAA